MTHSIRVAWIFSALLAVGCGDDDDNVSGNQSKCDKAYEIAKACGMDDGKPTSCSDSEAKIAQCVIDHPKGYCSEDLDDPESEAFFKCAGFGF